MTLLAGCQLFLAEQWAVFAPISDGGSMFAQKHLEIAARQIILRDEVQLDDIDLRARGVQFAHGAQISNSPHRELPLGTAERQFDARQFLRRDAQPRFVLRLQHGGYADPAIPQELSIGGSCVEQFEQILEHVWREPVDPNAKSVDLYVHYLRNKVDRDTASPLMRTVRGIGYMVDG